MNTIRRLSRNRLVQAEAVVLVLFAMFWIIPEETEDKIDPFVALLIAGAYAAALIGMLLITRNWTIRGVSIGQTMFGDGMLYLYIGLGAFGLFRNDHWLDFVRPHLIVGGILMMISVYRLWKDRRENPNMVHHEGIPENEVL